jgi:hypothetical protein
MFVSRLEVRLEGPTLFRRDTPLPAASSISKLQQDSLAGLWRDQLEGGVGR